MAFLGTPHGGSSVADAASVLGTIINTFTATASAGMRQRPTRSDLLAQIGADSKLLLGLGTAARNRLDNLSIVSFYESYATPPLSSLVSEQMLVKDAVLPLKPQS
jgi:hypothetical protein